MIIIVVVIAAAKGTIIKMASAKTSLQTYSDILGWITLNSNIIVASI